MVSTSYLIRMPKNTKKSPASVTERVASHRARMRAQGYRQIVVQLPEKSILRLDRRAEQTGLTPAQVIVDLLSPAGQRQSAK